MKLNLKSRKHELEIGGEKIVVRVRPLTILEFQTILGAVAGSGTGAGLDVSAAVMQLARDPEACKQVLDLLNKVVRLETQFAVETDDGERAGTLDDLLTGVIGLTVAASLFAAILNAGTLPEVEAKN